MQQLRDDVAYVGDPLVSHLIPLRAQDKHWIPVVAEHGRPKDGRVRQFRGDTGAMLGIAQLVPRRPTTGVFLTDAEQ